MTYRLLLPRKSARRSTGAAPTVIKQTIITTNDHKHKQCTRHGGGRPTEDNPDQEPHATHLRRPLLSLHKNAVCNKPVVETLVQIRPLHAATAVDKHTLLCKLTWLLWGCGRGAGMLSICLIPAGTTAGAFPFAPGSPPAPSSPSPVRLSVFVVHSSGGGVVVVVVVAEWLLLGWLGDWFGLQASTLVLT